jgi:hypothetical protein
MNLTCVNWETLLTGMFRGYSTVWLTEAPEYLPITPPAPSWPATCSYFSLIPFRPRMFPPGQASCRQTPFTFTLPSLRRRSLGYGFYHASCKSSVTSHAFRYSVYCMVLAGQQACPHRLSRPFLGHLGRSIYPVSQQIYSCLSLRPSVLVGSKWAFLHNIALPSASGSVAAAPPVTDIM